NITRPDGSRQPVGRVVRDLQRVLFIVERNHGRDRPEDFFPRYAGVVINVIEDSGLHIVTLGKLVGAAAARGYFGFFLPDLEIRANAVVLLLRHQGPHLRFALQWWTNPDLLRLLGHSFNKLVVNRFLHQDAAAGRADFSLIDEDPKQRSIDGGFEVGIGKKNVR